MSNPRSSHGVERYRWFWPSHGKRQVEVKRQLGAGRAKHHLKVSWGQSWCWGNARLSQKITVMYGIREPRNPLSGAPDMYLIYCFVEYDSTTIPLINWFIVKLVSLSWMSKNKKWREYLLKTTIHMRSLCFELYILKCWTIKV